MIYIISLIYAISFYMGEITVRFAGKNIPIYYFEIVTLTGILFLIIRRYRIKLFKPRYLSVLFALFVVSIIPLLYSVDYLRAVEGPKTFFFLILSYIFYTNIFYTKNDKVIEKFLMSLSYIFSILVILGIFYIVYTNKLYNINSIYLYKHYFQLPFGKSNYIAAFIAYFTILFFVSFFESNKKLYLILSMTLFLTILVINSRTSILATIVIISIFLIVNIRKLRIKKLFIFVFIIPIFFYIFMQTNFYELLIERFEIETSNLTSRFTGFKLVFDYLQLNLTSMLFGEGMGTEKATIGIALIHNVVIKLIYSLGLIGGGLYIIYYLFYIRLFRDQKISKKYLYAFITLVIISLGEPVLSTPPIEYLMITFISSLIVTNKVPNKTN